MNRPRSLPSNETNVGQGPAIALVVVSWITDFPLTPRFPVFSLDSARRPMMAAALLLLGACSDLGTAPLSAPRLAKKDKEKSKNGVTETPSPMTSSPAFVFVSDRSGTDQLYRFRNDSVVRLTFGDLTDTHPHSASGRIVFTSYRDGDAELYLADADFRSVKRLTASATLDDDAALSADASQIAFVSSRTGTPRLFVMDSTGGNQRAIETGSATLTPERAPTWSPTADRLAFTSGRTGTSQVFIVPSAGGVAVQLTNESGGAFDPEWNAEGTEITYVAWVGAPTLRTIDVSTGAIRAVAVDGATGEPSCNATACVTVRDPYSSAGDIALVTLTGGSRLLVGVAGNDHSPSVLR
jgi:dipeptidyl aminopeptidase/acylaminoacyl peptidase